ERPGSGPAAAELGAATAAVARGQPSRSAGRGPTRSSDRRGSARRGGSVAERRRSVAARTRADPAARSLAFGSSTPVLAVRPASQRPGQSDRPTTESLAGRTRALAGLSALPRHLASDAQRWSAVAAGLGTGAAASRVRA